MPEHIAPRQVPDPDVPAVTDRPACAAAQRHADAAGFGDMTGGGETAIARLDLAVADSDRDARSVRASSVG